MARESAADRLERKRRETGKDKTAQDLRRVGGAMAGAGKAMFGIEGDSPSQRLERARREEAAAKRRPTSGLKGTKLNRERGMSSRQTSPKTMAAAERKAAGRTKQSRRGDVKVTKEAPAFTKVERAPKTTVKAPKAGKSSTSSAGVKAPKVNRNVKVAKPKIDGPVAKSTPKTGAKAGAGAKTEKGKSTFRQRRLARLKKRLEASGSEGRQSRLKKRIGRVESRMGKDEPKKTGGMGGAVPPKNKSAKKVRKPKKMMGGGMMKAKGKANGGMMKAKGYSRGGKTNFPDLTGDGKVTRKDILKGRGVRGMKTGGMMKTKGATAGGKMKSKGYKKGGKVRGAGIARKGVRPAKMY